MNNSKARMPPIGLSDLKAGAGKRLGRFCLFCYTDFAAHKGKRRYVCGEHECLNAYRAAVKVDTKNDVYQVLTPTQKRKVRNAYVR